MLLKDILKCLLSFFIFKKFLIKFSSFTTQKCVKINNGLNQKNILITIIFSQSESPERLWELFTQYVDHERKSPLFKREYVGKDGIEVDTPLQVPITFEGFECYLWDLGIINDLGDYASNKDGRYTNYATIITRIRQNCFVQNFKSNDSNYVNSYEGFIVLCHIKDI